MVLPENNIVCPDSWERKFDYPALYGVISDTEISAGTVIAAMTNGITYLFQLDADTCIYDIDFSVMEGTLFEFMDENPVELEIDSFRTSFCRYPTSAELSWYNSLETI